MTEALLIESVAAIILQVFENLTYDRLALSVRAFLNDVEVVRDHVLDGVLITGVSLLQV